MCFAVSYTRKLNFLRIMSVQISFKINLYFRYTGLYKRARLIEFRNKTLIDVCFPIFFANLI